MSDVGVITEQGDLGLGFNPLSKEDEEKIKKEKKPEDKDSTK